MRAIGVRAFEEYAGHFWGVLETRPYMRALAGLACLLMSLGRRREAVEHYRELLRLNPNDNQGIRYILAPALLELDRNDEAADLLAQYPGDIAATWAYAAALLAFRIKGDTSDSRAALEGAFATNRFVPPYILESKEMPEELPEYIGIGDDREAVSVAFHLAACWRSTPRALEWMRAQLHNMPPPRSRQGMRNRSFKRQRR